MNTEKKNALYEALKEKDRDTRRGGKEITLDDATRVKVLSPSALVFKRFIRNRLAIVGSCILICMFLFAFVGPLFYPYSQTEIFYKYDYINAVYAGASERSSYIGYDNPESGAQIPDNVGRQVDSCAAKMAAAGEKQTLIEEEGGFYLLEDRGDHILTLTQAKPAATVSEGSRRIATIGKKGGVKFTEEVDVPEGFEAAAEAAVKEKAADFEIGGRTYTLEKVDKITTALCESGVSVALAEGAPSDEGFAEAVLSAYAAGESGFDFGGARYDLQGSAVIGAGGGSPDRLYSTLVFDAYETGRSFSDIFKAQALLHALGGEAYEADGMSCRVERGAEGLFVFSGDEELCMLSTFVVRDAKGNDTFDLGFKSALEEAIIAMNAAGQKNGSFTYSLAQRMTTVDADGNEKSGYATDEAGNVLYEDTELKIVSKTGQYEVSCPQLRYLIDLNAAPTSEHIFGTDSDGMDILARMMYGGRISLMVGFVVVILETLLGIIMGGIAGYFGGWVDNLIMRLVDIFYCIPSMPILIIMGAFMDSMKVSAYVRLIYMMAILGVLGWAGVARLVRGQILSLREQEFMVAAEATGLRVRRRIFRHLVPNVMPQLIVSATSGLGSVIITESTLSFLGLGVKHPLATWGTMINSVTSSNENMIRFTYIWIPVGLLICLTVIAFNFVGDGLRDAFDPKMKR